MVTESALAQLEVIAYNVKLTNTILLIAVGVAAAYIVCSVLWVTILKHI